MSSETTGNELVLSTPTEALEKKGSKPSLIKVGSRYISSDGRFHSDLAADYIMANARQKFVNIGEIARVFTGANTIPGKKRARKNMAAVFYRLLSRGEFLLYHTGTNGRIDMVKLLDVKSEMERQQALPQLERMKQRRQLSNEKYEKALQVIELQERLSE